MNKHVCNIYWLIFQVFFSTPVDEDTNEAWENSSCDHYEEVKENIYGKELEELPLNSGQVRLNNRLC